MAVEKTLSLIKPDGVSRNLIGEIAKRFESQGLRIAAMKMLHLSKSEAEGFYAVHKARPFFNDLTTFMASGPIIAMILEGDNAISKNREIMGATNPKDAKPGTIRKDLAISLDKNTVHGSDAAETAAQEIAYFFSALEQVNLSR